MSPSHRQHRRRDHLTGATHRLRDDLGRRLGDDRRLLRRRGGDAGHRRSLLWFRRDVHAGHRWRLARRRRCCVWNDHGSIARFGDGVPSRALPHDRFLFVVTRVVVAHAAAIPSKRWPQLYSPRSTRSGISNSFPDALHVSGVGVSRASSRGNRGVAARLADQNSHSGLPPAKSTVLPSADGVDNSISTMMPRCTL
jgi:hypothetical protein